MLALITTAKTLLFTFNSFKTSNPQTKDTYSGIKCKKTNSLHPEKTK